MSTSRNSFQHDPIDRDNEIRLLTLSPVVSTDDIVSCEISHHARSSCPEYEALSYTWGNLTREKAILCNGKTMMVTESCEAALRALRDRQERKSRKSSSTLSSLTRSLSGLLWDDQTRQGESQEPREPPKIWIDAICINQADMVERNGQVAQMGTIFGRASQTMIFLGEFDEDATFITKLLDVHSNSTKITELLAMGPSFPALDGTNISSTTPWNTFFQRRWFTRTWIIQEVMLSTRLMFLVGDTEIPWARMEMSQDAAVSLATTSRKRGNPRKLVTEFPLPQIFKMREMLGLIHADTIALGNEANRSAQSYGGASKHSNGVDWWRLFSVLKLTNRFQCRDPRDKLFAILHLFTQPIPRILSPDYSKSTGEVYTDLSWFFITCNLPEMFELAGAKQARTLVSSWVVNWSLPRDEASMTLSDFDHAKVVGSWNRSAGFKGGYKRIYARREREVLILRGLLVKGMKLTIPAEWDWRVGDEICVFLGFPRPSQIRRSGNGWRFVGNRDVPGLMNGQAVKHLDWSSADAQVPKAPLIDFRIY